MYKRVWFICPVVPQLCNQPLRREQNDHLREVQQKDYESFTKVMSASEGGSIGVGVYSTATVRNSIK